MITIRDCMPMMADVISGAILQPRALRPREDVLRWARETPAIRKLCAAWDVSVDVPGMLQAGLNDSGAADLAAALGDYGATVWLAGRLVVLNVDGTRCAFYGG